MCSTLLTAADRMDSCRRFIPRVLDTSGFALGPGPRQQPEEPAILKSWSFYEDGTEITGTSDSPYTSTRNGTADSLDTCIRMCRTQTQIDCYGVHWNTRDNGCSFIKRGIRRQDPVMKVGDGFSLVKTVFFADCPSTTGYTKDFGRLLCKNYFASDFATYPVAATSPLPAPAAGITEWAFFENGRVETYGYFRDTVGHALAALTPGTQVQRLQLLRFDRPAERCVASLTR